ncbi:MAG: N-acetylmuramoyl-L-alanine amidase [Pseudomonadota bacterium]
MRRLTLLFPLLVIVLCGFLAVSEAPQGPVTIKNIRMGVNENGQTRLVLDVEGRPSYLLGATGDVDPEIAIHIDDAQFLISSETTGRAEDSGSLDGRGHIDRVSFSPNLVRITLSETALPTRNFILPPAGKITHHRLVIDLDTVRAEDFASAAREFTAPVPTDEAPVVVASQRVAPAPSLKPRALSMPDLADLPALPVPADSKDSERPMIVLDPGHGGRDPGALGRSGTLEKNITLAFAKSLQRILIRRGYDVVLTRDDDTLVPHEGRIHRARTEGADLFLSIHADAHDDRSLRGGSVYTLSERRSAKMADDLRRDGDFILYDVEVSGSDDVGEILLDLAHSNTRHNSDRLASALVTSMQPVMPLVNNPKRRGALLVLLSPDVPAVLVELAFLSNTRDEANLASSTWRRTAANALADGIDGYFDAVGIEARLAGGPGGSG